MIMNLNYGQGPNTSPWPRWAGTADCETMMTCGILSIWLVADHHFIARQLGAGRFFDLWLKDDDNGNDLQAAILAKADLDQHDTIRLQLTNNFRLITNRKHRPALQVQLIPPRC